jgi:hypothetical protein
MFFDIQDKGRGMHDDLNFYMEQQRNPLRTPARLRSKSVLHYGEYGVIQEISLFLSISALLVVPGGTY